MASKILYNKTSDMEEVSSPNDAKNARKLEALFDNINILLWVVVEEPNGNLYYEKVNEIFASVTNRTTADYDGRPVKDLGNEDEFKSVKHSLTTAKKNGTYNYERNVVVDGAKKHFMLRIIAIPYADGSTQYIGTGVDITDRKKSEEIIQKRNEKIKLLYEASEKLSSSLEFESIFENLFHIVSKEAPCDELIVCTCSKKEKMIRYIFFRSKLDDKPLDTTIIPPVPISPVGQGMISKIYRLGKPAILNDLQKSKPTRGYVVSNDGKLQKIKGSDWVKAGSSMFVPFELDKDKTCIIQVYSAVTNSFNEDHLKFLESLSYHAALASKNALLFKQAQDDLIEKNRAVEALNKKNTQFKNQQDALLEISKIKILSTEEAFKRILELASAVMNIDRASIWLFSDDGKTAVCKDMYESGINTHTQGMEVQTEDYANYFKMLRSDEPVLSELGEADPRMQKYTEEFLMPFGTTAMFVSRIRVHGDIIGFFRYETKNPEKFEWEVEEFDFVVSISGFVAAVLEAEERMRAEEEIKRSLAEKELLLCYIERKNKEVLGLNKRMNILQHQALSAMMNPHFIFNSLNSVQHLVNTDRRIEANDYISLMARLIRMNLNTASQSYITIEEETKRLELYLTIEKLRCGDKLSYKINIGKNIKPKCTNIPNMIIQPFVENAIWHGLMPSDKKGILIVSFELEDVKIGDDSHTFLMIRIIDNGIGLKEAQKHKKQGHISKGIKIIHERLDILSQERGFSTPVYIKDVKKLRSTSEGTEVILSLPPDLYKITNEKSTAH
jgi:transcriptional regulator with GAF, ATPase, and Fis domain